MPHLDTYTSFEAEQAICRPLLALSLAAGLALFGCSDSGPIGATPLIPTEEEFAAVDAFPECAPDAPTADVPAEVRDSIVRVTRDVLGDGELAAIARRTPGGFGGLWLEDGGERVVLGLVDPAQAEAALAALAEEPRFADLGITPAAEVVPVRWTFAQLLEWSYFLEATIYGERDLVSVDRDELANRIVLGVSSQQGRDRLLAALRERGDVPCQLVRIEPKGPVVQQ